jgi:ankyrin repeat protein
MKTVVLAIAERGRAARVKEIVAADPRSVHLHDDFNNQPLHVAARYGRAAIAELLLDAGAGRADGSWHLHWLRPHMHYEERHPAIAWGNTPCPGQGKPS